MSRQGESREEKIKRIKRIKRRIGSLKKQIEFFNTVLVKQSAATKIQALVRKKQAKARKKSKGTTGKENLKKTLALLENRLSKQEQALEEAQKSEAKGRERENSPVKSTSGGSIHPAQKKDPPSAPSRSEPGVAKESATVVKGPLHGFKEKKTATKISQNLDFYAAPFSANLGKYFQAFAAVGWRKLVCEEFSSRLCQGVRQEHAKTKGRMGDWADLVCGSRQTNAVNGGFSVAEIRGVVKRVSREDFASPSFSLDDFVLEIKKAVKFNFGGFCDSVLSPEMALCMKQWDESPVMQCMQAVRGVKSNEDFSSVQENFNGKDFFENCVKEVAVELSQDMAKKITKGSFRYKDYFETRQKFINIGAGDEFERQIRGFQQYCSKMFQQQDKINEDVGAMQEQLPLVVKLIDRLESGSIDLALHNEITETLVSSEGILGEGVDYQRARAEVKKNNAESKNTGPSSEEMIAEKSNLLQQLRLRKSAIDMRLKTIRKLKGVRDYDFPDTVRDVKRFDEVMTKVMADLSIIDVVANDQLSEYEKLAQITGNGNTSLDAGGQKGQSSTSFMKAMYYIQREIVRLEGEINSPVLSKEELLRVRQRLISDAGEIGGSRARRVTHNADMIASIDGGYSEKRLLDSFIREDNDNPNDPFAQTKTAIQKRIVWLGKKTGGFAKEKAQLKEVRKDIAVAAMEGDKAKLLQVLLTLRPELAQPGGSDCPACVQPIRAKSYYDALKINPRWFQRPSALSKQIKKLEDELSSSMVSREYDKCVDKNKGWSDSEDLLEIEGMQEEVGVVGGQYGVTEKDMDDIKNRLSVYLTKKELGYRKDALKNKPNTQGVSPHFYPSLLPSHKQSHMRWAIAMMGCDDRSNLIRRYESGKRILLSYQVPSSNNLIRAIDVSIEYADRLNSVYNASVGQSTAQGLQQDQEVVMAAVKAAASETKQNEVFRSQPKKRVRTSASGAGAERKNKKEDIFSINATGREKLKEEAKKSKESQQTEAAKSNSKEEPASDPSPHPARRKWD